MSEKIIPCPICEFHCCIDSKGGDEFGHKYVNYRCEKFNCVLEVENTIFERTGDYLEQTCNNMIENILVNSPRHAHIRYFDGEYSSVIEKEYVHYVNINRLMGPEKHSEKIDRSLMNIYRCYGDSKRIDEKSMVFRRCLFAKSDEESLLYARSLVLFGYLSIDDRDHKKVHYDISKEGWKHIDEMLRNESKENMAFIAISFNEMTKEIREFIKKAVSDAGYEPILINEVEHNNQIVPEIAKYIEKCSFLVMDCSLPNNGAYYEAGMAKGYGKPVIICCRKDVFDNKEERPHFDVVQQSMIIWETGEDLIEKLKKRIILTI